MATEGVSDCEHERVRFNGEGFYLECMACGGLWAAVKTQELVLERGPDDKPINTTSVIVFDPERRGGGSRVDFDFVRGGGV